MDRNRAQVLINGDIRIMATADHAINMKHPIGDVSLPSPKYNLTCSVYRMPHPEDWTPPECYEYESCIYANYTASPDAEVSIHTELTGANAWVGSTDGLATTTWTGSA